MLILKVGLHYKSPRVVKLEIGLHYRYLNSEQKVCQGGEANNGASLWNSQGSGIHYGASSWKFQGG